MATSRDGEQVVASLAVAVALGTGMCGLRRGSAAVSRTIGST
jgi:hypothetical protein